MADAPKTKTTIVFPKQGAPGVEDEIVLYDVTVSEVKEGHLFINTKDLTAVFSPGSWIRARTEIFQ